MMNNRREIRLDVNSADLLLLCCQLITDFKAEIAIGLTPDYGTFNTKVKDHQFRKNLTLRQTLSRKILPEPPFLQKATPLFR